MSFDAAAIQLIDTWLNTKGSHLKCAACDQRNWDTSGNGVLLGMTHVPYPMPAATPLSGATAFVPLRCNNCGYTVLVAKSAVGL